MAYATSAYIAMAAMAAAAAAQAYNTNQTAKRQDNQAAQAIINQSKLQRQHDARINEEVQKLGNSTMEGSRAKRMQDYMSQLGRNRQAITSGLTPNIGSEAFQGDAANAANMVLSDAGDTAGLLARMDAPDVQRQAEGNAFGHLATETDLLKRRSAGQSFIDDLKYRAIRRNPKIDLAAGLLQAVGSAYGGMGAGGASSGGSYLMSGAPAAAYGGYGVA